MVELQVVCTLGPRSDTPSAWLELAQAGATAFRIPFAKETPDAQFTKAESIRQIPELANVGLFADLPGQAPRTGNSEPIEVREGDLLHIGVPQEDGAVIGVSLWERVQTALRQGAEVTFGDGEVRSVVVGARKTATELRVVYATGPLQPRRRVAWAGWQDSAVTLSHFEETIVLDDRFRLFDGCMLSYVRSTAPIEKLRTLAQPSNRRLHICAKLEDMDGINAIGAIGSQADSVLIGQGDLLVSVGAQEFATAIYKVLRHINREPTYPIIFGTGLLDEYSTGGASRAELGYLAALVNGGCRSFMLAGETTIGTRAASCVRLIRDLGALIEPA